MKILSPQTFANSRNHIFSACSELLRQRWIDAFEGPNPAGVVKALAAYQNPDGGFGHNLEGDFILPESSPMATSVAFQILTGLGAAAEEPLVRRGIAYLLATYLPERPGWLCVPPEVNDAPHASWWHFQAEKGGTVIDRLWGNPSAELAGYLVRYSSLVPVEFLNRVLAHTLAYFYNFSGKMEMHELYCFLRFAGQLPEAESLAMQPKLADLVRQALCIDPADWTGYCAQPLDFISSPQSFLYPMFADSVQANLDFRIDAMTPAGIAPIPWNWDDYPAEWLIVRPEIAGREALKTLILLKRFGRLTL